MPGLPKEHPPKSNEVPLLPDGATAVVNAGSIQNFKTDRATLEPLDRFGRYKDFLSQGLRADKGQRSLFGVL
jgi:hypothetical protein